MGANKKVLSTTIRNRIVKAYIEERQNGSIVYFYNNRRPHMSIGRQASSEAHLQYGEQQQCRGKKYYDDDDCDNKI